MLWALSNHPVKKGGLAQTPSHLVFHLPLQRLLGEFLLCQSALAAQLRHDGSLTAFNCFYEGQF